MSHPRVVNVVVKRRFNASAARVFERGSTAT